MKKQPKQNFVDLKKIYNFVVDNIFIRNNLSNKNYVWFLKFKIWIFQTTLNGETPETKVVEYGYATL